MDLKERICELAQALVERELTISAQERHIEALSTELRRVARALRDLRGERGQ